MTARYLVLGVGGQLAQALSEQLGSQARFVGLPQLDLMAPDFTQQLELALAKGRPHAVINAAAYTQVDKAQGEGAAMSLRINAEAVGELAQWCVRHGLPLVHVSTDYVFDGSGKHARREDEQTAPLNAYGAHKLAGEQLIEQAGGDYLIFRTSWLYDAHGNNFFNTMLRLMKERETLRVVADQIGAPTYVPMFARELVAGLEAALSQPVFPRGVYHLAAAGETSWHGFATAIFTLARAMNSVQNYSLTCQQVLPIATSDYPVPAARPKNSRLSCEKAKRVLGVAMDEWMCGLEACFRVKFSHARD
ncbi:MAG: dTDP-4-dehydrorhamnose reductase [Alphaproteobacteria bacterium]|nr:dTDP-4-dehydrorhamnose reductase [Alphaproteobacteria bacterium]